MSDLCSVTSTSIFLQLCYQGWRGFDLRAHREGHLFTGGVYYTTRPLIALEAVMIVRGEKAIFFPLKKWAIKDGHSEIGRMCGVISISWRATGTHMCIRRRHFQCIYQQLTHDYSEMIRVLWKKEVNTKSEIGSGGVHQKWWHHLKA